MLQNPCKTLGFKKNMVYKIPPGGEVNHIQPVAYYIFSVQFINIISRYTKIGYNIDVLQTACWIMVNLIMVGNFACLSNCILAGQTSGFMTIQT